MLDLFTENIKDAENDDKDCCVTKHSSQIPEDWAWDMGEAAKTLTAGETITANAVYNGQIRAFKGQKACAVNTINEKESGWKYG